jgi:hypothetical protein
MVSSKRVIVVGVLVAAFGCFGSARADESGHGLPTKKLTPKGTEARKRAIDEVETKQFHQAGADWALVSKEDPVYWWNAGDAYDKAGEGKKAVDAYRAYIKAFPRDEVDAEVQERIKQIEAANYKIPDRSKPAPAK